MAIYNFSYEWTDWHLTPKGWVKGNCKTDFHQAIVVDPPKDRVLTRRYIEIISNFYAPLRIYRKNVWNNGNSEEIIRLFKQFRYPNSLAVNVEEEMKEIA